MALLYRRPSQDRAFHWTSGAVLGKVKDWEEQTGGQEQISRRGMFFAG